MTNVKQKVFHKAAWARVFYHTIVNRVQFKSVEEAKYIVDNPDKFSILSSIDDRNKYDGQFEFLIEFDGGSKYVRWKQNINPLDESESGKTQASGFKLISSNYNDPYFKGLARTPYIDGCIPSLLNGNFEDRWFYCIGLVETCSGSGWDHSKLPGSTDSNANTVSLWMRIPRIFSYNNRKAKVFKIFRFSLIILVTTHK